MFRFRRHAACQADADPFGEDFGIAGNLDLSGDAANQPLDFLIFDYEDYVMRPEWRISVVSCAM